MYSDYTRNIYQIVNHDSTRVCFVFSHFAVVLAILVTLLSLLTAKLLEMLIELQNDRFDLFCMFLFLLYGALRLF